jgi:hypothetical protein
MASNSDVKKLVQEFQDTINLGFKLFEEYKKKSEKFVESMENEISEIKFLFENTNSLSLKKEKLNFFMAELGKKITNPAFREKNNDLKQLSKSLIRFKEIAKKMIQHEKEFIKYKREKRKDKEKIYDKIIELQAALAQELSLNDYKKLLKEISEKEHKIGNKTYRLKHLIGHLKAGFISDAVNNKNNVNEYKTLDRFIRKEKNMIEGIKILRETIKIADKNKKIKSKKENQKDNQKLKLLEELSEIKQKIIKIYEAKFVGLNTPPKIEDIIKKLKKQSNYPDELKEKIKNLEKTFNELVSEYKKL